MLFSAIAASYARTMRLRPCAGCRCHIRALGAACPFCSLPLIIALGGAAACKSASKADGSASDQAAMPSTSATTSASVTDDDERRKLQELKDKLRRAEEDEVRGSAILEQSRYEP
jgi:hypothetical protein